MPNQIYNITCDENTIRITKNSSEVYAFLLSNRSINLKDLYDKMCVDISDEYTLANGLKKFDEPNTDVKRVFNNTYDFIETLLSELNKKLKELRSREDTSVFK